MGYYILLTLIVLNIIIFPKSGITQTQGQQDSTSTSGTEFKPNTTPELNVPRIPNGKITIDGVLDEAIWKDAAVADNFTEISPGDNVKPEVETIAYVAYDDEYILDLSVLMI